MNDVIDIVSVRESVNISVKTVFLGKPDMSKWNVDALVKVINSRDVAIVVNGLSVKELDNRIQEFKDIDFCWLTLHRSNKLRHIPKKIGKVFEVLVLTSSVLTDFSGDPINVPNPLEKSYSIAEDIRACKVFVTLSPGMLKLFPDKAVIYNEYGINTLYMLLKLLNAIGVKKTVMFGADGYSDSDSPYYNSDVKSPMNHKKKEIDAFNKSFLTEDIDMEIVNVSEISKYTCFKNVSYEEFLVGTQELCLTNKEG